LYGALESVCACYGAIEIIVINFIIIIIIIIMTGKFWTLLVVQVCDQKFECFRSISDVSKLSK